VDELNPSKEREMVTGYLHPLYAASLSEFGEPYELPRCKGWILKREIPGFPEYDAMGCYPLFACQDWSQLYADLEGMGNELVCLSLVTDPFGEYGEAYLRECFKDVVVPFKEHFITDLSYPIDSFVSEHHSRYAQKALREVHVEKLNKPEEFISEWMSLYSNLSARHNIKGLPLFSESSFRKQLNIPGIVVFRAIYKECALGMILWYLQGHVGYYHLGAYSDLGYKLRVSFALFWYAFEYFAVHGVQWLNLGAGAGINGSHEDGLNRFKRGWSTGTQTAYFCGRIFDHRKYLELVKTKSISVTDYFPAYRMGEYDSAQRINIRKDIEQE
jgi:hypothetical protein